MLLKRLIIVCLILAAMPGLASDAEEPKPDESGTTETSRIIIDGQFDDWLGVESYRDPGMDTHDTDHDQRTDKPIPVEHPDVDLLEYKVASDELNLYFYVRAQGHVGRTQTLTPDKEPGRYYVIVAIDVDRNDETGYWIHEGGYYPTSNGYDVNAEIEYFDGQLNTVGYMNHGARDAAELRTAFFEQSQGRYESGRDGPYPAGFMRILSGTYKLYTHWVYHADDTLTFVRDKGPIVRGIATAAKSADSHQLEAKFPLRGFLKDETGKPIIAAGSRLDLSFSLEASDELSPGHRWASDTAEPIVGYVVGGD